MIDQDFMKLAIEEARNSLAAGGAPIGAIMVKDGEVIAKGWSMVWPEKDPTSHAETNCIKFAYKKLHPKNLSDCTMYSTLESCSMCLGCGSWAGLFKVVFGAYSKDIPPNPYELSGYTNEKCRELEVTGIIKAMDQRIIDFLTKERVCVLATPYASATHFTFDQGSTLIYFVTHRGSKKLENLGSASVVIGFSEQDWITVQFDGKIEIIVGTDEIKNKILAKYPEDVKHMDEESVFLRFTPTWWRYSDYKNNIFLTS
ncbi:pyridoxamine 5'-phosphate oxidase family protein [Candidatus Amesbacteria bacterium]|nr:pyridoxamine 5'-phosphate oxidase family protein [Candidatus Amesbacteria bacterium]